MKKYLKYQDYVIKDGKLVGEFEQMYQDFDDPWEQSTREKYSIEKKIGIELLKRDSKKNPLEYGCGFGHYTDELRRSLGFATGIDISKTAIKKAKQKYPKCNFFESDFLNFDTIKSVKPDAILLVEITWYVLEQLKDFKNILRENLGGGHIFPSHAYDL